MSDLVILIPFAGFMAAMWAMTRPVKCKKCGKKEYVAHFNCPEGGSSFFVK